MASTLLARSWSRLPRRPVVASPGYRSFSVRKARPAPGRPKPADRRGGDAEVRVRGQEGLDAVGLGVGRDAELVEHLHQRLAAAGGIGAQQQAALASLDQRAQLGDRILGAARHADVGRGAEIGMRLAGGERQAAEILQLAVQRFRVQEQRRRRQHRALAVALEKAVPAGRILAEALHGIVDVAHGDGDRVIGQIVEQRRGLVEEQRQVVFDAGEGMPLPMSL